MPRRKGKNKNGLYLQTFPRRKLVFIDISINPCTSKNPTMATRKPRKTITVLHDLTVSLEVKREEKGGEFLPRSQSRSGAVAAVI